MQQSWHAVQWSEGVLCTKGAPRAFIEQATEFRIRNLLHTVHQTKACKEGREVIKIATNYTKNASFKHANLRKRYSVALQKNKEKEWTDKRRITLK